MNGAESVESYFTDVQPLRDSFNTILAAPALPKHLLFIHGVGGAGKSSLLWMLRLQCKKAHAPTALASGKEAKSIVDILAAWTNDFKADKAIFTTLTKTIERYRLVQIKVSNKIRDARGSQDQGGTDLSKGTARTIVSVAAGFIPVVGPLASALGSMGTDVLIERLQAVLPREDLDLFLNPEKRMSEDFLTDLTREASKHRIVLMLDDFEHMEALEYWVRDFARQLCSINVLFVIAGRNVPKWNRYWPGWMAESDIHKLEAMDDDIMRELVRRYYATLGEKVEPKPEQVEEMVQFARGLPVVATSVVQLWVIYKERDFQVVKSQVLADLVDRLLEGVPRELVPALEAASVVRWFNKEILRHLTGLEDVNAIYDELHRFPFMRSHAQGFALHDAIQEIMDENMRVNDPKRYARLHEQAAEYFEARLAARNNEALVSLELEQLYHRICANEDEGIVLFQSIAEGLVQHRQSFQLLALLNDAHAYPIKKQCNWLWRKYYEIRLAHLEGRISNIENEYQLIAENNQADGKLRAYALCDLGEIISTRERLVRDGEAGKQRAISVIERSLDLDLDAKLMSNLWTLGDIYRRSGDLERAQSYYQDVLTYFESRDQFSFLYLNQKLCWLLSLFGDFPRAFEIFQNISQELTDLSAKDETYLILRIDAVESIALQFACMGKYQPIEILLKEALQELPRHKGNEFWYEEKQIQMNRELGYILGLQNKFVESSKYFDEALSTVQKWKFDRQKYHRGVVLGFYGYISLKQNDIAAAEERLFQSLRIKEQTKDAVGVPELLTWIGELHEKRANQAAAGSQAAQTEFASAEKYYQKCIELRSVNRRYFECQSLVGLARVMYMLGDNASIPPLIVEADQMASKFGYKDQLASICLLQGHMAWNGHQSKKGANQDKVLRFYQQALVFALQHNRFLFDEILSGSRSGIPTQSILVQCLEHGDPGKNILTALRDWWQQPFHNNGLMGKKLVPPLQDGIVLFDVERAKRELETGDGSPQQMMCDRITAALD